MSVNIPQHYAVEYADLVALLSQQRGSKLAPCVMTGSHKGKLAAPVDQIGQVAMQPVTGRFMPKGRVDATVTRRWCSPNDRDLNQLMDSFDELRLVTDPKAKYLLNGQYAAGREMDNFILDAMFGTALIGETGTGTQTFPSAQDITVTEGSSGSSKMNVAKLRRAVKIIRGNNVDLDNPMNQLWCALNANQYDAMFAEAQVVSTDFNDRPVLVDGRLVRFFGVNFVHTELIDATSSIDQIPVWAKSGVHLGIWQDMKASIGQRIDLTGDPYQVYLQMTMGATRIEEAKVVRINCAQ